MPQQFNAIIATQTDHFRGTSGIQIKDEVPNWPNYRSIAGAAYAVSVTGGVSGSFGVHIIGSLGGSTYTLAGLTSLAAGNFVLYPTAYTAAGAEPDTEAVKSIATNEIHNIVPPSVVVFQSAVATVGISATITVSACINAR